MPAPHRHPCVPTGPARLRRAWRARGGWSGRGRAGLRQGTVLTGMLLATVTAAHATVQDPSVASLAAPDSAPIVLPGDVIRLRIWREPDMSGDVTVDEAGVATLPRLGPTPVAGMRADSLKARLVTSYTKYLRDPSVDITVLRRVTILGAVRNPNVYHVEPTMTLADALALAGGASPDGKQEEVELRRKGEPVAVKLSHRLRMSDTPIRSGDELYVPQRSWFSRNSGLVLGAVGTLTSVLFLLTN